MEFVDFSEGEKCLFTEECGSGGGEGIEGIEPCAELALEML